jgi:hypothetical protein
MMRLAAAHDSTDRILTERSSRLATPDVGRLGQALASTPTDSTTRPSLTDRVRLLLHVLAVCSGLALLVIAALPVVSG